MARRKSSLAPRDRRRDIGHVAMLATFRQRSVGEASAAIWGRELLTPADVWPHEMRARPRPNAAPRNGVHQLILLNGAGRPMNGRCPAAATLHLSRQCGICPYAGGTSPSRTTSSCANLGLLAGSHLAHLARQRKRVARVCEPRDEGRWGRVRKARRSRSAPERRSPHLRFRALRIRAKARGRAGRQRAPSPRRVGCRSALRRSRPPHRFAPNFPPSRRPPRPHSRPRR
jgi:hypothetical protein